MNDSQFFFHEDDYCQIEFLPTDDYLLANIEIEKAKNEIKFDELSGFTNMHVIKNREKYLDVLNIKSDDFIKCLRENSLFFFNEVLTGYSNYREKKKNTIAFGYENYIIFVESKNEFIYRSWITYQLISQTLNILPKNLKQTLILIGNLFPVILVDWQQDMVINLKKEEQIENYILLL